MKVSKILKVILYYIRAYIIILALIYFIGMYFEWLYVIEDYTYIEWLEYDMNGLKTLFKEW